MLGTEKIEAAAESLKKLVIAGKKISEDGKVGVEDIAHLVKLMTEANEIVKSFKDLGEAFEEVKDLDVAEVIALIQVISKKIKEVEAA